MDQFNVDLLEDIADYWVSLLGSVELFPSVNRFTVATLRRYSEGSKKAEFDGPALKKLFSDSRSGAEDLDESLFPGLPNQDDYIRVYDKFVKLTRQKVPLRSFQSLSLGTKTTLEPFYYVMEYMPYLLDPVAHTGYQGGAPLNKRPRVETSLMEALSKSQYYAVVWYCICNWQQMNTASSYRPHEALSKTTSKEVAYWRQYKFRVWFQLAYCICVLWQKKFDQFPKLLETLKGVRKFSVQSLQH